MAVERFIVRRAKMVHVRVLEPDEGDLLHATVVALGEVAKFEVVFRRGERRHRRTNIRLRHVRERNNAVFATYVVHAANRTSWAELESRFAPALELAAWLVRRYTDANASNVASAIRGHPACRRRTAGRRRQSRRRSASAREPSLSPPCAQPLSVATRARPMTSSVSRPRAIRAPSPPRQRRD